MVNHLDLTLKLQQRNLDIWTRIVTTVKPFKVETVVALLHIAAEDQHAYHISWDYQCSVNFSSLHQPLGRNYTLIIRLYQCQTYMYIDFWKLGLEKNYSEISRSIAINSIDILCHWHYKCPTNGFLFGREGHLKFAFSSGQRSALTIAKKTLSTDGKK